MTKTAIQLKLDPNKLESKFKLLGGGKTDEWNKRLSDITVNALPHSKNKDAITEACLAVSYGVMDMAPADPVEGILIAQLMAANEAALAMYQKGWAQPPEYFEARAKYLALADKAARTVVLLTERLDHHRGRGQQQIVVKHVTVNADQAVVTDNLVTSNPASAGVEKNTGPTVSSAGLLTVGADKPMAMLQETIEPELLGGGTKTK